MQTVYNFIDKRIIYSLYNFIQHNVELLIGIRVLVYICLLYTSGIFPIRPLTAFYVHLHIARYVFSRQKYFEHPAIGRASL